MTDRPTKGPDGNDVYHNTSAPTYVVVGSAGAMQEERWIKPTPDWSAVRFANGAGHFYTDSYGYGSLVVGTFHVHLHEVGAVARLVVCWHIV